MAEPSVSTDQNMHERSETRDLSRCSSCSVGDICIALGSEKATLQRLDELLTIKDPIAAGDHIVRQGERFRGLLAVRSGCFKSFVTDRDGEEHVQGFHFAGELIGMEGISRSVYAANVVALQEGAICSLNYGELLEVSACSHTLQKQLFRLFASRIAGTNWRTAGYSASECIAAFLLDISERRKRRGLDPNALELLMSRRDIADYLGLATETVSRTFSKLKRDGMISVRRKHVRIDDRNRLCQLAASVLENT